MAARLHITVPALILVVAATLRVVDPPILVDFRLQVFDYFQELRPRPYQPTPVRVVDVDDESLKRIGQWPWPRVLLAELLTSIRSAGAVVVAFDMTFAEPDRTTPLQALGLWPATDDLHELRSRLEALPDHDEIFAAAIERSATAVLGFILTDGAEGRPPAEKAGFGIAGDEPSLFVPSYTGVVSNLAGLESRAAGNGSLNIVPERDGLVRRVPLLVTYGNTLYPSLVAEAVRVAEGAQTYVVKSSGASGTTAFGEQSGVNSIKIGTRIVPTDGEGRMWLYDTGIVGARTISAHDVLRGTPPKSLDGAIVFVGTSAAGLKDLRTTPLASSMPGVEVNAQLAEQMYLGEFLRRPDWASGAELVYLIFLGTLLVWLIPKVKPIVGAAVSLGVILLALGFSWLSFTQWGFLFAPIYPVIVVMLVYLTSSLIGYLKTEQERRYIRNAWGRYLSPVFVNELVEHHEKLKLGGEMRDMSVLFCDIRGFTSISEKLDAEELTTLINRFLTPMSKVILDRRGTIDKYMGDCIMAFWNAPLDDPRHVHNACETALHMVAKLMELNRSLTEEALRDDREPFTLRMGVGINTGICCVGNMGSEQRFAYSVLGNDVNVASRLEGQSKTYGVDIVIGEQTQRSAQDFATLELDLLRVKGKTEPVRVHALLGDSAVAEDERFCELKMRYRNMLRHYRDQNWDQARQALQACRVVPLPIDLATLFRLYEDRCAAYAVDSPGSDWDGVFIAMTK